MKLWTQQKQENWDFLILIVETDLYTSVERLCFMKWNFNISKQFVIYKRGPTVLRRQNEYIYNWTGESLHSLTQEYTSVNRTASRGLCTSGLTYCEYYTG